MSKDIESRVSAALRPVAPREEFSQRLLARVMAEKPVQPKPSRLLAQGARPLAWWFAASLAACLILAVGVEQHVQQQRLRQSGLEARREVLEPLRLTSQKLNLAYEAVKSQSTSPADEKSGA